MNHPTIGERTGCSNDPMTRSSADPISKAFVFAAGRGTRLQPYTLTTPKPMLDVLGRPLVEHVLCGLARAGLRHATVNTAHLADAFEGLPDRGPSLGLAVALSRQPRPLEHAGDLAFATAFWDRLGPDEAFLAVNGDTIFDLDPDGLRSAARALGPDAPLMILAGQTAANPLLIREGRLVGLGGVRYADGEPDGRADDAGLKLAHASLRRFLPAPGTPMSLHGPDGLVERVVASGASVPVRPAPIRARVEIGTVADYEGREANAALRSLVGRLCG